MSLTLVAATRAMSLNVMTQMTLMTAQALQIKVNRMKLLILSLDES